MAERTPRDILNLHLGRELDPNGLAKTEVARGISLLLRVSAALEFSLALPIAKYISGQKLTIAFDKVLDLPTLSRPRLGIYPDYCKYNFASSPSALQAGDLPAPLGVVLSTELVPSMIADSEKDEKKEVKNPNQDLHSAAKRVFEKYGVLIRWQYTYNPIHEKDMSFREYEYRVLQQIAKNKAVHKKILFLALANMGITSWSI